MANIEQVEANAALDEEVVDVPILQPNGEPYLAADGKSPSTIGVLGAESKRYIAAQDRVTQRLLRMQKSKLKPEEMRSNRIAQVAAACVRWSGWESNGQPWEFSADAVKALLARKHILEQVEAAIDGHADFFAKPLVS